jgi:hypothetical protein
MTPEKAAEMTADCRIVESDGDQWFAIMFCEGVDYFGQGATALEAVIAAHSKTQRVE